MQWSFPTLFSRRRFSIRLPCLQSCGEFQKREHTARFCFYVSTRAKLWSHTDKLWQVHFWLCIWIPEYQFPLYFMIGLPRVGITNSSTILEVSFHNGPIWIPASIFFPLGVKHEIIFLTPWVVNSLIGQAWCFRTVQQTTLLLTEGLDKMTHFFGERRSGPKLGPTGNDFSAICIYTGSGDHQSHRPGHLPAATK